MTTLAAAIEAATVSPVILGRQKNRAGGTQQRTSGTVPFASGDELGTLLRTAAYVGRSFPVGCSGRNIANASSVWSGEASPAFGLSTCASSGTKRSSAVSGDGDIAGVKDPKVLVASCERSISAPEQGSTMPQKVRSPPPTTTETDLCSY